MSIVICAISVTLPIGVSAAIYLNEYARDNLLTRIIKLSIVNLAGVPSVSMACSARLFVIFLNFGCRYFRRFNASIMELPLLSPRKRSA